MMKYQTQTASKQVKTLLKCAAESLQKPYSLQYFAEKKNKYNIEQNNGSENWVNTD